ncbi:hypothetical protein Pmani_002347 [Petrolisthes manimaculis]|uniref:Adipocyte plasma membrane-associated protein n=1 Tax=Petrolisthes manimaculis TaxID=1843537 RepID=A0AAE1QL64_9EUCA|nr:hypothetical protein Pmani_002347 [Petrolisthes manimaculis]
MPTRLEPPLPLEGALARNNILDRVERVLDGQIVGPESIASRQPHEIFVGVEGGKILRIWGQEYDNFEIVSSIGPECDTGGMSEEVCGRPLGLRFTLDGKLLVADCYLGIWVLNVDTGKIHWLHGSKAGQTEVFVDRLPGSPDNIRSNGKDGYYIAIVTIFPESLREVGNIAGRLPLLRQLVTRILYLTRIGLETWAKWVSSHSIDQAAKKIFDFLTMSEHTLSHSNLSVVVEVDGEGEVIGSLQGHSGQQVQISQANRVGDYMFLGSPFNSYLGKLYVGGKQQQQQQQQVTEGQQQVKEGQQQVKEGQQQQQQVKEGQQQVKEGQQQVKEGQQQQQHVKEAQQQVTEGQQQVKEGQQQVKEGQQQVKEGQQQQQQVKEGQQQVTEGQQQVKQGQQQVKEGQQQVKGQQQVNGKQQQVKEGQQQVKGQQQVNGKQQQVKERQQQQGKEEL